MSWAIYGSYQASVYYPDDTAYTPTAYNAAAADLYVFTAPLPLVLVGLLLEITTAYVVDAVAQVLSLDYRVTHNSDVGRVELCTITAVNAWADGEIKANFFSPVDLAAGQQFIIEQKVQGTSGGAAAGAGIPKPLFFFRPEITELMDYFDLVTV